MYYYAKFFRKYIIINLNFKVQGNIVDVLMPPLSELELTFSYALGGVTRGILVEDFNFINVIYCN